MPSPSGPNAYPSSPGNYPSAPNIQSAGTATLTAAATLGGPAVVGDVATSTLAATAGLSGNAGVPTGAATLAATAGLGAAGVGVTSGGTLLAAVGALAGTAVPPGTSATLPAAGGLAGSGPTATEGAGATLTATAAMGSAPTPLESAAATLMAVAALAAAGVAGPTGTATLTATGTLPGAITTATVAASVALAATAGLAASSTAIHQPVALPTLTARATLLLTVSGGGFDAPTLWNPTLYDLVDGSGTIYPAGTTRAWPATPYVRRAVLAGLLVTIDGYRFTGFGNPAAPQRAPRVAELTPTGEDRRTVGAGQSQPVDATLAPRTVLLPPAAVGIICEVTKVDQTTQPVTATPHGTDTILGATPVLTVQGAAVRLFGAVDGGWVAVPVDQRTVAGTKTFTAPVTLNVGQTVQGGQTVDAQTVTGTSTVQGLAALNGGATILGGASVAGGQAVAGGQRVVGGFTADTMTSSGWKTYYDRFGNSAWTTGAGGSGIVSAGTTLYVTQAADTTQHAALVASALTVDGAISAGGDVHASGNLGATGDLYATIAHVAGINCTGGDVASTTMHVYGTFNGNGIICTGVDAGPSGAMLAARFTPYSDRSLKHSIEPLPAVHAAELIGQCQPCEFGWHTDPADHPRTLGFVAQELPERLQRPMTTVDGDDLVGYDLSELLAATVAVVQQQRAQIEALTARVDALEERVPEC